MNGVVSKNVEVGMNVHPGQQLAHNRPARRSLDHRQFQGNSTQRTCARDSPSNINVDANGAHYKGHVDSIAGSSGARFSLLPPENATGNYVKVVQRVPVKIVLDPGQNKDHYLPPGNVRRAKVVGEIK